MLPNLLMSNSTDLSKSRIVKNLIVISLSFFFLYSGNDGLFMLQTTMNKKAGVGTISLAINFITCGTASLTCSSFFVKKLGCKNAQILGMILMLPYIASNVYPTWFTMFPAALLRGIGFPLLSTAKCTYFNESSVLFGKIEKNRGKFKYASNKTSTANKSDVVKETTTVNSDEQKVEQLSACDRLSKAGGNSVLKSVSDRHANVSPVRFIGYRYYKDESTGKKSFLNERSEKTSEKVKDHSLKILNDAKFSKALKNDSDEGNGEKSLDPFFENTIKENDESEKCQSYVDSMKSLFFGIHGLAFQSASVFSSLISYYVLKISDNDGFNNATNLSCGAGFCIAKGESLNNSIAVVPNDTRYLLTGICIGCAFVAPLLILLFLDRIFETKKDVKLSWDHVLATVKYVRKTDQLLLIPFTIGVTLCRGFYMSDFTKSYIACSWNISQIGLITAVFATASALSSIFSGVIIKYVGRIVVMALCQIIVIANYVFLFFWNADPQQPYMFYVQAIILGMMTSVLVTQTRAFYGVLFEGDEETAFSSCTLYNSIGWALPFIYNDFFCTSVKIYIVLAFSCTGFLCYLLAERRYRRRNN